MMLFENPVPSCLQQPIEDICIAQIFHFAPYLAAIAYPAPLMISTRAQNRVKP